MPKAIAINLLIGVFSAAIVLCLIGALVTWTADRWTPLREKIRAWRTRPMEKNENTKPVILKDLLNDLERPKSIGDRIRDYIRHKQPLIGGYGLPRPEYTLPVMGSMVNDAVINGYKINATQMFAPAYIGGMNVQAGDIITLRNIDGTEHRITAVATGSAPNLYAVPAPPQINYIPSSMDRVINPMGANDPSFRPFYTQGKTFRSKI